MTKPDDDLQKVLLVFFCEVKEMMMSILEISYCLGGNNKQLDDDIEFFERNYD